MPDLVIKGMALPKTICGEPGYVDVRIFADGSVIMAKPAPPYYGKFEAVPLPEGHGKLIDIKDVKSGKFHIEGRAEMYSAYNIGWNDALDAVCMNAPSIIPAEGGADNG